MKMSDMPAGKGRNDVELKMDDIYLSFGGLEALRGISLDISKGQILSIIGPNGAGKTCILNCVSGFYRASKGRIYFKGRDITQLATYRIAKMGIGRTFQNIELFNGLNVLDNLLAGRHSYIGYNPFVSGLYFGRVQKEEVRNREIVEEIIDFLEMQAIRKRIVGTLPFGMRKRVELGRALATQPEVLILDEPMAGMNLEEKEDMARFILDIFEEMTDTIVLIEHDMGVVMDISHRVAVIEFGEKIAEGPPDKIARDPVVIKAYIGDRAARELQ